jgi:hypothetical protein
MKAHGIQPAGRGIFIDIETQHGLADGYEPIFFRHKTPGRSGFHFKELEDAQDKTENAYNSHDRVDDHIVREKKEKIINPR